LVECIINAREIKGDQSRTNQQRLEKWPVQRDGNLAEIIKILEPPNEWVLHYMFCFPTICAADLALIRRCT
jgi:hypothetical protein